MDKQRLRVAVIGSFRLRQPEGEQEYAFKGNIANFKKSARILGSYIAQGNHEMLVAWSKGYRAHLSVNIR